MAAGATCLGTTLRVLFGSADANGPTQDSHEFTPGMRQPATLLPIDAALAPNRYRREMRQSFPKTLYHQRCGTPKVPSAGICAGSTTH